MLAVEGISALFLPAARATAEPLQLPIPAGQTWYVCQGYNGQVSHEGAPALDISLEPRSAGSKGCLAGSRYSSAGSVVRSPGVGTAYQWPGCCGDDFVCVNLDSGGSVAVGHLSDRIPSGSRVDVGTRIGSVAWPGPSNGDYGHIHVQAHPEPDCTEASDPVAFDVAHGSRFACTPDLPYSGAPNQYSGLALKRCRSDDVPVSEPLRAELRAERAQEARTDRALMRALGSVMHVLSTWM